jgi:hypothetical protein
VLGIDCLSRRGCEGFFGTHYANLDPSGVTARAEDSLAVTTFQ